MPELPEVETVVRYLNSNIKNNKLISLEIKDSKFIKNLNSKIFKEKLVNQTLKQVTRKGKYLMFHFSNDYILLSHLRMEGKYFIYDKSQFSIINQKHNYLIFEFSSSNNEIKYLVYNDTRKFGTFHLYHKDEISSSKELMNVGFDPLEQQFNFDNFYNSLHLRSKSIKSSLLDQKLISGIGNIYASEILYASKIYPFKKSKEISIDEAKVIIDNSKKILLNAIDNKGTTISTFSFGHQSGHYQDKLQAYGRHNQNCIRCNEKIIKTMEEQRSTFYCPKCQKK